MKGHLRSVDGRFALRRVNQGEMGDGLQVWPNARSIPKNTKLLAFEIIEVFENVKEFDRYCEENDHVWALKFRRRHYVYDQFKSTAHLVNQLPKSQCNLKLMEPKTGDRRVFLNTGDRPIKGGSPLGIRYNSRMINKTIAAERKLRDQRRFSERLRSFPQTKTVAWMAGMRRTKEDRARLRREQTAAAREAAKRKREANKVTD